VFYLSYIGAELRRRAGRTALTALGLGVGVGLVVTVTALSNGLDDAQQKVLKPLTGVGTDMSVTRPLRVSSNGQSFTPGGGSGGPGAGLSQSERDALLAVQQGAAPAPATMLLNIKGIGPEFAAILWSEGLFRHFDNRRQVASYAGLAPTPWQSGSVDREQGVSKAGNPRLRTTLIQLAWLWLRNQPQSALALWFKDRVSRNGGRLKKTTIVALARKLLVALWKYVTAGVVIEGAIVKSA